MNVRTGEKKVVYEIKNNQIFGPGVGAASYSPVANQIVFIHGLNNVTEQNPYQQWRRTGVMIDEARNDNPIYIDARDINPPFTKGALRGGHTCLLIRLTKEEHTCRTPATARFLLRAFQGWPPLGRWPVALPAG